MQHRTEVEYRVVAERNNHPVLVQRTKTREKAEALARRITSVPGTVVSIEEIIDPAEGDITSLTREISESIGWRDGAISRPVNE